ncbi:hypothetical protein BDV93DRAFT_606361 [Ceratobasidium sp. AG-I]|nr:hypothetical protein BDV93DRAFT_606361 [Ceratobasidium sp. AG-I]
MTLAAPFQVRIRRQTSADLWVQVTAKTTILEIKRKIFEDGAIPPNSQKLTWDGKSLSDDDATLESYGITTEVDIYVEFTSLLSSAGSRGGIENEQMFG